LTDSGTGLLVIGAIAASGDEQVWRPAGNHCRQRELFDQRSAEQFAPNVWRGVPLRQPVNLLA
jgi:hypothetical protein